MLNKRLWKHKITGVDGNCKLFGVNIFDYEWNDTGEVITVKDPVYKQEHSLEFFTVDINGKLKKFAAGEFSNCIWSFYVKRGISEFFKYHC